MGPMVDGMMGGWWMWVWMLVSSLFVLLLLVLLILLIAWLARRVREEGRRPAPSTGEPDAAEILGRRYARGEITREEFEEMRRALG